MHLPKRPRPKASTRGKLIRMMMMTKQKKKKKKKKKARPRARERESARKKLFQMMIRRRVNPRARASVRGRLTQMVS